MDQVNPYFLKNPSLISFSGGRTSGYMLYQILKAHDGKLPDDVFVVFANTGKEMPETLDFIQEVGDKWGIDIRWLELDIHDERPIFRSKEVNYETASRNGEPFEALIDRKMMLPNTVMRICTVEMKIKVLARFMRSNGFKEWDNVVGLRYDEPHRVARMKANNDKDLESWFSLAPLYDAKVVVEDVSEFWNKSNFDLQLTNFNGKTPAGNCDLCYLKGVGTLTRVIKEKPELADWWIAQEEKIRKHKEKMGSKYNAQFKNNISFIELKEQATAPNVMPELFPDDGTSCFCTD
mgnify:FL=1|tara:strand:+ start:31 stop:906 length:876 start_codon:yes stop_codon:yes gene_type:complete